MRRQLFLLAGASVAGVGLLSGSAASAASVTVQNPSFETPGGGSAVYTPATGWVGNSFSEISADVGITTGGTGARYGGQESGSSMTQDLGVSFAPSTKYTLQVSIGNRPGTSNPDGTATFGLTAGGADVGTFTAVAVETTVTAATFGEFSYIFTTGPTAPTGNVGVRLGAVGGRALYDNVRLDATAVPEPATAGLAGVALAGLLARRRRVAGR